MRQIMKNGCDYCFAESENISRGKNVYPVEKCKDAERKTCQIADSITNPGTFGKLKKKEKRGFCGQSPTFVLSYADAIQILRFEKMHNIDSRVVKSLYGNIFESSLKMSPDCIFRRVTPELFNRILESIKIPIELWLRTRRLDLSHFKAIEYRNCQLFFFTAIYVAFENVKVIGLILMLSYLARSLVLPLEDFRRLSISEVKQLSIKFCKEYEEVFGKEHAT